MLVHRQETVNDWFQYLYYDCLQSYPQGTTYSPNSASLRARARPDDRSTEDWADRYQARGNLIPDL